ncbi:winged helix-turn-helix transcriptional regulator [Terriglobus roseus]|jgi:DNA-binding HxlR family transcriptional regulator|uniref:Transcriptional regulator, HxlR family n=1 Tax=Terriglobus roseus TaxID=392734 RepID=A0A1H4K534_9BACT|nr:helix-turn-helix domain-containing protein [Terriglobus roseus]SEB53634.1 transcriptional regulator, HxlR family [Terriglobus roseus]
MARTHEKVRYLPTSNLPESPGHTKDDWSADAAEEAFKLLEGRWKMMIVFHLFDKTCMRFSELERAIPLVSQKMLIQQLRDLESKGIVTRMIYQEVPPRVEYSLTDLGKALRPALRELVQWANLRRKTWPFKTTKVAELS